MSSHLQPANNRNDARQLLFHGALMILLGLLSGFTARFALSPRIALGTHTLGILQGTVLIALAGAWHLLNTKPAVLKTIKYTLLIGFYGNWLGMQLAALWSAGQYLFPAHARDMPSVSTPLQNLIVIIIISLSLLVLISSLLIMMASRNKKEQPV